MVVVDVVAVVVVVVLLVVATPYTKAEIGYNAGKSKSTNPTWSTQNPKPTPYCMCALCHEMDGQHR